MSRSLSHTITFALLGLGMVVWAFAGYSLVKTREIIAPLNFMGINRSPYGEVLAMAMQGPIDTQFKAVNLFGGNQYSTWLNTQAKSKDKSPLPKLGPSVSDSMFNVVEFLGKTEQISTNPRLPSEGHKLHLRRQAENKLRFAYQLDPSHYGNYAILHFFLVEGLTTYDRSNKEIIKLTDDTIQYCLSKDDDPRRALTACSASIHMIHLMFEDRGRNPNGPWMFTVEQMRKYLTTLDQSIAHYDGLDEKWQTSKSWDNLSKYRVAECQERINFTRKLRDGAEQAIIRVEKEAGKSQLSPFIAR
jgi:hypothetical protein